MSRIAHALLALGLAASGSAHAGQTWSAPTHAAIAGGVAALVAAPALGAGSLMIKAGPEYTAAPTYAAGMGLYAGGYVAATTGSAALALGSLTARHRLVGAGATGLSAVPGALSLGAFAVTASFAYVVPMVADVRGSGWIGATAYGSTLALGALQLGLNERARRRLPTDRSAADRVTVAPTLSPGGLGMGLHLPL